LVLRLFGLNSPQIKTGILVSAAKAPFEAQILDALKKIFDPDRRQDIVALGMVQGLVVKDGHVAFSLEVDAKRGGAMEPVRKAAEKAAEAVPGVLSVSAVLTAQKAAQQASPRQSGTGPAGGPNAPGGKELVPGVRAIVAVASGKGGVGKSTTATNLALA
jgi:ATP-binding protein involved in chromosome partitioning